MSNKRIEPVVVGCICLIRYIILVAANYGRFPLFALFLRYFSLFDMQMSGITSHMRNDLSKKYVYLFHSRTKSFRIEKFGVVGETRTCISCSYFGVFI